MKKIIAFLLALVMSAGLIACSDKEKDNKEEVGTTAAVGDTTVSAFVDTTSNANAETTASADTDNTESAPSVSAVAGSEGLVIKEYEENCEVRDVGTFSGTELIVPSHVNGKPVTYIDEDALTNDTMISLYIPGTVISVGEEAVSESKNLRTVTFNEGLIGIGYGSFAGCVSLQTVTLPSTLETVGQSAFRECSSLSEVTLNGNSDVKNNAFSYCASLKKVTFAGSAGRVYSLGSSAFESDAALEEVKFAEGLDTIGAFCFSGCTSLGAVYLPSSLKKIEASAFNNVGALMVFYAGSEEEWQQISVASNNDALKNAEITYDHR